MTTKWPPLDPGTRVKTLSAKLSDREWMPEALLARKWGVTGTILRHHDSHGLCYDVLHDDGGEGCYDPSEFEVIEEPTITIRNGHIKACGPFPKWAVDRPKSAYFSFFMGESGDQWVFVATPQSVKLAGGDCEWGTTFEIMPTIDLMRRWEKCKDLAWPKDLILDGSERLWLTACMKACSEMIKYHLEKSSEDKMGVSV